MDFCMGPQSGQGVPAEPDEIGLSWELVSFNASLTDVYRGQLPGWGSGDLVSVSAFNILNTSIVPALTRPEANKTQYMISASSLVDLTSLVSSNGSIWLSRRDINATSSCMLFASYARRSFARANIPSSEHPENILQNGSFAVDHFSRAGANLMTSFLETHVIQSNSTIRTLFKEIGQYIWEDSPEISTPIYWTPDLLSIFKEQHGYDLRGYIPFLTGFNGDLMLNNPPISIVSDSWKDDIYVDDFRSTLTGLYQEYLTTLKHWTHEYLGMEFSAQVGYNLPVDMLSSIPTVDVPETETLAFLNNIDAFRQYSGASNLAGGKITSLELGADYGQAYSQPLSLLIEEASRAYAVGINQVVIHGASYSGYYPQTTYPGFTSFGYTFGAQHSRHQPAWNLGYEATLNWLARAQFILQSGVPKIDVVFWDKQTAQDPYPSSLYQSSDLSDTGYSYTYVSPDNFALPSAVFKDGLFAPKTLGAQVLVLRQNDTLTPFGVDKLAEYARAGLLVIIEGGIPIRYSSGNMSAVVSANSTLHSLLELPNVHMSPEIALSGLSTILESLKIKPRTSVQTNGVWYTRFHTSPAGSETFVFIFSDTINATEGTISVTTTGTPYFLDLWNGIKTPIIEYQTDVEDGTVIIPMKIAAKQAVMIQFNSTGGISNEVVPSFQDVHVVNAPNGVLGYAFNASTKSVVAQVRAGISSSSNETNAITFSNGTTIDLSLLVTEAPAAFNLTDWTLDVEKWMPPSNLSEIDGVKKEHLSFELQGSELVAWPYIDGLANTSGIGTYTNTFAWPPSDSHDSLGAYLHIPDARLNQGLSVSVNSFVLPNVDVFDPRLDIGHYLCQGSNNISISVSTTLWNSLRPVWSSLRTGGTGPQIMIDSLLANAQTRSLGLETPVGLVGVIQIVPYMTVTIL